LSKQDVFASAQAVTRHPVLREGADLRHQYYAYLKKLIRLGKWNKQKYVKAQLAFYKQALCGDGAYGNSVLNGKELRRYSYLLPFDIASVLSYRADKISPDIPELLVNKIVFDFGLPNDARDLLRRDFSAAFGDAQAWDGLLKNGRLRPYSKYLKLVRKNILFRNERPYKILITATMSAGKSTLINAIAGKNISLMQNMAATSKIHTIVSKPFDDGVTTEYDAKIALDASKEDLMSDSGENKTKKILVSTYFAGHFSGQRLVLLDTPGVNSSENPQHTEITRNYIRSKKYKLMLYVLNATQLGTNDDGEHLEFVSQNLGKSKIIFVMNKIDSLISEDESVEGVIGRQRDFLISKGFKDPIICPVSARAAYLVKKGQQEQLSRVERRELENFMDKFELNSLSDYYEGSLGRPAISGSDDESNELLRNCGFSYMEEIIDKIKNGGHKE